MQKLAASLRVFFFIKIIKYLQQKLNYYLMKGYLKLLPMFIIIFPGMISRILFNGIKKIYSNNKKILLLKNSFPI